MMLCASNSAILLTSFKFPFNLGAPAKSTNKKPRVAYAIWSLNKFIIKSVNCKRNAGTFPATVHDLLSHGPANPPCQNGRFGNLPFLASSPPGWLPCLTLVGCASSIWNQFIILASSCQRLFSFFICIFLFQASSSTGIIVFRRRLSWFFRIFLCIFQRKMVKSILIKLTLWLKTNTKESSPWKLLSLVAVP